MSKKMFSQSQLQAIADAIGDTDDGLTGSEISFLLESAKMSDPNPTFTKRHRLYNAFVECQNSKQDRINILAFIRKAMKPEAHARRPDRFEPLRAKLNRALLFAGLIVTEAGVLENAERATTLTEAQRRAAELRTDLEIRKVHSDVLRFCREELLAENYFHAVLEAAKSVADKIRDRTGLTDDGAILVDHAFGGEIPLLAINELKTETERSEQRGFLNLIKGMFGLFRNPTAHVPKIKWAINKEDAEEVFSLLSLIHKRIDLARMPSRS